MANKSLDGMLQHIRKLAAVQTARESADHELLKQFVADKDDTAFAVLVERHGPMVLGVCRRTLGNPHDAEDACQASFLVLAQKAASIRKTTSLSSWLHGVALRVASNLKRERLRRCRRERESRKAAIADPAAEVSWREVQAILDEELEQLPERLRAPLILCYLDGLARDEAARQLGLALGCLHGRLERGRMKLCARLTRRGITLPAALMATALGQGVSRAALSPTVVLATARAAVGLGACGALDQGLISAEVVSLAQEVLRNMFLTRLKLTAVVCAGLLLTGIGGSLASLGAAQDAQSPPSKEIGVVPVQTTRSVTSNAGGADAASKDARALEGEWEAVGMEWNGMKVPSYQVRSLAIRFTFKGEQVKGNNSWMQGSHRFKLDPARSPRAIDIGPLAGQWKSQFVGIYSLEAERLLLCLEFDSNEGKRPTAFKTHADDRQRLFVLERVAPNGTGGESERRRPHGDAAADEFGTVLRDWRQAKDANFEAFQRARTIQDQQKVRAKLGPYTQRCLKLAETYRDTPAGLAALCWVVSNAPASEPGKQAFAILKGGRIARADLDELGDALGLGGADWSNTHAMTQEIQQALAPIVLERVQQQLDHPRAAQLLDWITTCYLDDESAAAPRTFAAAADLIAGRFADSPDINHLSEVLGVIRKPRWAGRFEKHLRAILKANPHAHVRLEAQFALASVLQEGEGRQEEAKKLYQQFIKDYTGRAQNDGWDDLVKGLVQNAKDELDGMLVRGIGETAPEIEGQDLDGKPMKLSDFRGKVVLVSFWATWCSPCMKLVPHERALVERLNDKPFAIVGVNADRTEALSEALKKTPVTWRSFKDKQTGKNAITKEWMILSFPTLFLIDQKGVIRKRWIGAPPADELDREIDRLVGAVSRGK